MKLIGRHYAWWLTALVTFALVAGLRLAGRLQPLENAAVDARARMLTHEVRSDIVIVGIDAASLAALDEWPWPRRHHARLIDELTHAAPRRVFIDIDFSSQSNPLDDALLDAALARPRDFPVMLPIFFQNASGADQALAISQPLRRFARSTERAVVNGQQGPDGLTRQWRNFWMIEGTRLPSVIDPSGVLHDTQDVPIDFSISPTSFTYVSYVDLLEGRVPHDVLAGKSIFVGATSVELNDMVPVPIHRSLPGIVVQALAAETVNQRAPSELPAWASIAWLALWTALAACLYGASWPRNLAVLLLAVPGAAALSLLAFELDRLLLDTVTPMLIVGLLFVAATVRALETQTWRAVTFAIGMRRRDALLKSVVQSSTDCIVCVDEAGIIKTANPAASRLFRCAAYELIDQPIAKFITLLAGDGAGTRLGALHGEIRECDARSLDGAVFPVEISVSRVRLKTDRLYTAIIRDIRERRAQQRLLQHQATHDPLTGLPNRAALLAHLEAVLGAGAARPTVALLMLDLCRFKEVNDTLGHGVGDRVLCEVAHRFASAVGDRGLIARIGGDEFTLVLDRSDDTELIGATSRLLTDCLRSPIEVSGISIEVGVSIGIARCPQDASDAQTLLRHADVAMYVAKRRGTAHEYYDPAHDENTVRRLTIGGELRSAIANGGLELHFQPQVNLRNRLVESVEALLRWKHADHGDIGPNEFIEIAEATDLIRPLTEWTLRTALAQVRDWRARGVQVRVAVNLSARLLQDSGFPARLRELLDEAGVPPMALELEITESAMMLDPARALRVIQEIDEQGVLISIDDFGTGYSSLGYLRDLPVHSLKLDKSFVQGMRDNPDDRIIVESTAQMAHALKLELIAEGVETEWDSQFLAAAGYDYAQGFRYTRALPAKRCLAWIQQFNATSMLSTGDTTITAALRSRVEQDDDDRESRTA
jgi:diguanylate cyclase (GGDEF)-like protein/PAS domain S-box-containing protein